MRYAVKILRIVYEWPPPWDGLAPAPYELSLSQVKLGHEIEVFCGRWPFSGNIETIPKVNLRTFMRELLPGTLLLTISPWMFVTYLMWRRKNYVDVVHSHGHFGACIYLFRKILKKFFDSAKELETPLVVHFHNTVAGRREKLEKAGVKIKPYSKYLAWPLAELSDKWAVEAADACIFVSQDIKNEAVHYYGADPSKCYVVETGVNPDLFKPVGYEEKGKTRDEMGLNQEDKIILNHGVMVERKNIHMLVESLPHLPEEYKLLLVGSSDVDYGKKIEDLILENNLESRVKVVGYTPYPEVPIAFQASDIFVLPSEFEGLPKVVMQSLACGIPVLASGFKTQEEIKGLYYLSESSPKNIAKQIKEVLESHEYVDVGLIRLRYSWDVKAQQIEEVYKKVLRKRGV